MQNEKISIEEIKKLNSKNTAAKEILQQINQKVKEIDSLKKELLQIDDKLMHYDVIDMITDTISITKESSTDQLISILTSVRNCLDFFAKEGNLEYLSKTRKTEKIIKVQAYHKLMQRMNLGEGFVQDKRIIELLDLAGEEIRTFFRKQFFLKRQKELFKKVKSLRRNDSEGIYFLIQHELSLKEKIFVDEDDFFLYEVLVFYFHNLKKEEIESIFKIKPQDSSRKVFNKYLKIYYEENYGKMSDENVFDL